MTAMCLYSRMLALVHNFKCFTSPQLCRDLPDPILIGIINFQYYSSNMLDFFFRIHLTLKEKNLWKFSLKEIILLPLCIQEKLVCIHRCLSSCTLYSCKFVYGPILSGSSKGCPRNSCYTEGKEMEQTFLLLAHSHICRNNGYVEITPFLLRFQLDIDKPKNFKFLYIKGFSAVKNFIKSQMEKKASKI